MARRKLPRLPRWHEPAGVERAYRAELRRIAREFSQIVREELLDRLPAIVAEHAAAFERRDSWVDSLERAVTTIGMRAQGLTARAQQLSLEFGQSVAQFNRGQMRSMLRAAVGVDYTRAEPWLADEVRSWAAENARLITSIPEQSLTKIEGMAQRGVRSGASAQDIAREIRAEFDVTDARARLIARDQVSKLNGDLTRKRQEGLGIELYRWQSSRDERVRASHDALEGKLCRWDDPTVYSDDDGATWRARSSIGGVELHPGEDFQCRCHGEPAIDKLLDDLGL